MDKLTFNEMDSINQLEYINSKLQLDTLTQVCKNIGIARTTVSDRLKKIGYSYNSITKVFTLNNELVMQLQENITKVSQESHKRYVEPVEDGITKELQKYRDDLMELVNYKDDILELLKYHKNNINVIDVPVLDINSLPNKLQTDIINKSIKVYKGVYKLFDEVCENYPSYKKQDIISLMIYEFYNKYKK